jgi:hypothetical protein
VSSIDCHYKQYQSIRSCLCTPFQAQLRLRSSSTSIISPGPPPTPIGRSGWLVLAQRRSSAVRAFGRATARPLHRAMTPQRPKVYTDTLSAPVHQIRARGSPRKPWSLASMPLKRTSLLVLPSDRTWPPPLALTPPAPHQPSTLYRMVYVVGCMVSQPPRCSRPNKRLNAAVLGECQVAGRTARLLDLSDMVRLSVTSKVPRT